MHATSVVSIWLDVANGPTAAKAKDEDKFSEKRTLILTVFPSRRVEQPKCHFQIYFPLRTLPRQFCLHHVDKEQNYKITSRIDERSLSSPSISKDALPFVSEAM